jgi:hypothetical protein
MNLANQILIHNDNAVPPVVAVSSLANESHPLKEQIDSSTSTSSSIVPKNIGSRDRLSDALTFIDSSFDLKVTSVIYSAVVTPEMEELSNKSQQQAVDEKKFVETHSSMKNLVKASQLPPSTTLTTLDKIRLLLSHLGYLEPPYFSELRHIHDSDKVNRELELLDRSISKVAMRVGVVYVGFKGYSEAAILGKNMDTTSYSFREFVLGLGWEVDLKEHAKSGFYMGNIDVKSYLIEDKSYHSIYYSDSQSEVVYHVCPLIPASQRKKLIGSAPVVIVWCESVESYNPDIMISGAKQIFIVVYPYRKQGSIGAGSEDRDLFRIQIIRKERTKGHFG